MTKKHFIDLANVLKFRIPVQSAGGQDADYTKGYDAGRRYEFENMTSMLADFCAAQNPRFDRERWLGYIAGKCGPSGGKRG